MSTKGSDSDHMVAPEASNTSELRRLDRDLKESVEQIGTVFDRLEKQRSSELSSDVEWTIKRKVRVFPRRALATYVRAGLAVGAALLFTVGFGGALWVLKPQLDSFWHHAPEEFTEQSEPQLSKEEKRKMLGATGSGGLASIRIGVPFPGGGLSSAPNQFAFFEFAPLNGTGMGGSACGQCANLFSAPEDAVSGTGWNSNGVVVAPPTMTADYAIAPNGTLTADRMQVAACPALGNRSERYNTTVTTAQKYSEGMYMKSNTGTVQTISICSFGADAQGTCTPCVGTADGAWVQCKRENFNGAAGNSYMFLGCNADSTNYIGASNTGAADVSIWGGWLNAGATLNTYDPIPTGAKAEVLTFTRASTATCTKGNETTSIQNGDLVQCQSGTPRVMPGSSGTGALGQGIWEARTNSSLQSEALENGAYATTSGAGCTITADAAVAPDGNTTADRVQCASGGFNGRGQTVTIATQAVYVFSVYAKDIASSNGLTMRIVGTGNSAGDATCEAKPIASTSSWSRLTCTSASYGAGLTAVRADVINSTVSNTRNLDAYLWGWSLEVGPNVSPYIATTSAAATRAQENLKFQIPNGTVVGSVAISLANYNNTSSLSGHQRFGAIKSSGASYLDMFIPAGPSGYGTDSNFSGVANSPAFSVSATPNAAIRAGWERADATDWNVCQNGTCQPKTVTSTTAFPVDSSTFFWIGNYFNSSYNANTVVKQVCLDPNPSRCR